MYFLAKEYKGIHNFVNHDKYKGYGCTWTHEFTKETRNVVQVKELKSKGLHCTQIAHELGLHRHTVEKYVRMSLEEFQSSQAYERDFKYKLGIFEEEVKNELIRAPYLSSRQVHDHLREHHADFPEVSEKTVFNFVMRIRDKYHIPKGYEETFRPMEKLPESAPGKSTQADFGEYWMHRDDTRRVKVYFFAAVMSCSRHKFVYFSRSPFTTELSIYAHQLAFWFYGGKPGHLLHHHYPPRIQTGRYKYSSGIWISCPLHSTKSSSDRPHTHGWPCHPL